MVGTEPQHKSTEEYVGEDRNSNYPFKKFYDDGEEMDGC